MAKTIRFTLTKSYRPPKGYRIVMVRLLSDGSVEITIEPLEPIR